MFSYYLGDVEASNSYIFIFKMLVVNYVRRHLDLDIKYREKKKN